MTLPINRFRCCFTIAYLLVPYSVEYCHLIGVRLSIVFAFKEKLSSCNIRVHRYLLRMSSITAALQFGLGTSYWVLVQHLTPKYSERVRLNTVSPTGF